MEEVCKKLILHALKNKLENAHELYLNKDTEQEGLNEMYLQLYPVKIARKKILVELVRVFGSANFRGEHLDVLSKIFFQFGQMESVLLKIFAKGIVRPIASYHLRPRFVEAF